MKRLLILLIILLVSCNKSTKMLKAKEYKIVKNGIQRILELETNSEIKNCYLVSPYLDSFSLENYSDKTKSDLFNKLGWSDKKFDEVSEETNNRYKNIYYQELIGFSNCDESYSVITISGLNDNLLLIKLEDSFGKVSLDSLNSRYKFPVNQAKFYSFFIGNNGEVIDNSQEVIFYN